MYAEAKQLLHTRQEITTLDERSIFDYYSIENDIDFIHSKIAHVQEPIQRFYLHENVHKFLAEFAAKVPYTSIDYVLRDGRLYYTDIPAAHMYAQTADQQGVGSREMAEYEGFVGIEETLIRGQAVTELSPAKVADYGLAFHFEPTGEHDPHLGGIPVKEYILRYGEDLGKVDASNRIRHTLTGENIPYMNPNQFLTDPLARGQNLHTVMRAVGVSERDVERSEMFERLARKDRTLRERINEYIDLIIEPPKGHTTNDGYQIYLEQLLTGIYNRAKEIVETINDSPRFSYAVLERALGEDHRDAAAWYALTAKEAKVAGGGSCPVVRSALDNPFASSGTLREILSGGTPLERSFMDEENKCPHCGGPADGHYHCDDCGKMYADETDVDPEERTPQCSCGRVFGC